MLLSVKDNAWKITDFGLSSEGTSRIAYTTRHSRGTPCYRAPELIRQESHSFFTKNSDIWALGCIFYELAFKEKAFPDDYHVFEFIRHKRKPQIHSLPVDTQSSCYIGEFIYRMLEIDWWRRPSARDVRQAIDTFFDGTTRVWVLNTGTKISVPEDTFTLMSLPGYLQPEPRETSLETTVQSSLTDLVEHEEERVPAHTIGNPDSFDGPIFINPESDSKLWTDSSWRQCWFTLRYSFS